MVNITVWRLLLQQRKGFVKLWLDFIFMSHYHVSGDLRGVAGGDGKLGCLCGKAGTSHLCDGSAHSSGCMVNGLWLPFELLLLCLTIIMLPSEPLWCKRLQDLESLYIHSSKAKVIKYLLLLKCAFIYINRNR